MTGYYTFKWGHPANEVYVTGTFDGWSQSTKLDKAEEGMFVKKVELPVENILYKFVVDGNWVTDPNAPLETEESGVQNNILFSTVIEETEEAMNQAMINSAAPQSTTAALASTVPTEENFNEAAISSAAPESTTAALAGEVPVERPTASAGDVPGGFPETPATEKIDPTPQAPKEESQVFSVNPLPASDTVENPITLKPGEPVPTDVSTQSIHSNVQLDKESYEKGPTNFPIGSWVLPDVVTPAEQRVAEGRGVLDLPKNLIPESSLPISSAAEADKAPEVEVPEIVKESQEKANAPAEASAVPEVAEIKAEVESELKSEVAVQPPTAEGNTITNQAIQAAGQVAEQGKVVAAGAASGLSAAVTGVATATGLSGTTAGPVDQPATPVPEIVKASIAEAGAPAEAAAVASVVEAKKEVEVEIKEEVVEAAPTSEGPKETPAVAKPTPALAAKESAAKISGQATPVTTNGVASKPTAAHTISLNKPADIVPEQVKSSVVEAGVSAEAASESKVVGQKVVEQQLKENEKSLRCTHDELRCMISSDKVWEERLPVGAFSLLRARAVFCFGLFALALYVYRLT